MLLVYDYFDYERIRQKQTSMTWRMVNLRRALQFRYYIRDQACSGNYSLVALSLVVQPLNYNEPVHIHLAYGDRLDQMLVSYLTNSAEVVPRCQYGPSPTALYLRQSGSTATYTVSDMCDGKATTRGPQAFIDPGFMHTILIEELQPSTTYFYRVGSDEYGWSSIFSFTNRPASADEPVTMIAYGDLGLALVAPGTTSTIDRVVNRVMASDITCLLHIGDVSYARGFGAVWDAFMTAIEPIAARVPYMVGIGNHEYGHLQGGFRPGWYVLQNDIFE